MVYWLYGLLGLAFIIVAALLVWLATYLLKEKEKEQDSPIFINFLSKYSQGRLLGVVKNVIPSKNNRIIIEYDARDVDLNRVAKTKEDTSARVILPQNKLLTFPKGTASTDRNIMIGLPINPEDLNPAIRETPIGVGLMMATELKNYEKLVEEILREGTDRRDNLAKEIGDGQLSKIWVNQFMDKVKDFMDATVNAKLKEKQNDLTPQVRGYGT